MAIRNLVQVGEAVIRAKAKKVLPKDKAKVKKLIKDMTETMRATSLIGIAAPQVGESLQLFLSEIKPTAQRKNVDQESPLTVYINPKITYQSKQQSEMVEGCGSLGLINSRLFGLVRRPVEVEVEALDANFKPFKLRAKGLLAKCIQHEFDHLQGVIVLDRFTDTRKCFVRVSKQETVDSKQKVVKSKE
jgi:peptide deformylase